MNEKYDKHTGNEEIMATIDDIRSPQDAQEIIENEKEIVDEVASEAKGAMEKAVDKATEVGELSGNKEAQELIENENEFTDKLQKKFSLEHKDVQEQIPETSKEHIFSISFNADLAKEKLSDLIKNVTSPFKHLAQGLKEGYDKVAENAEKAIDEMRAMSRAQKAYRAQEFAAFYSSVNREMSKLFQNYHQHKLTQEQTKLNNLTNEYNIEKRRIEAAHKKYVEKKLGGPLKQTVRGIALSITSHDYRSGSPEEKDAILRSKYEKHDYTYNRRKDWLEYTYKGTKPQTREGNLYIISHRSYPFDTYNLLGKAQEKVDKAQKKYEKDFINLNPGKNWKDKDGHIHMAEPIQKPKSLEEFQKEAKAFVANERETKKQQKGGEGKGSQSDKDDR